MNQSPDIHCYIDESRDEGINTGGSRWFILGALFVPARCDLRTSAMVARIKQNLGRPNAWPLHWSKVRKDDQKLMICRELHTEDYTFAAVAADKTHSLVTGADGLREKYALYFYSARLLLERLSWWTRDNGYRRAMPIFEKRSNISYDEMRGYFRYPRTDPRVQISWPHIEYTDFEIEPKTKKRLLQATDCLCGALKDGLEYSGHGFVEPRYIQSLRCRIYRRNGNLFSYGLKFLHATSAVLSALKEEYDWLKAI